MICRIKRLKMSVNHDLQNQEIKNECKSWFAISVYKLQFAASVNHSLQN